MAFVANKIIYKSLLRRIEGMGGCSLPSKRKVFMSVLPFVFIKKLLIVIYINFFVFWKDKSLPGGTKGDVRSLALFVLNME